jgi:Nucleotidyl transferase AbiEii toxin, Type IV TA system
VTDRPLKNVAASVRQRLLNLSREQGEDYQRILIQFAIERLIYRMSRSSHASRFVLKGATLFSLWSDTPHRSTRDLDLWSRGESSIAALEGCFREICATPVEDDGVVFTPSTVRGSEIRIDDEYLGVRLRFAANLGGAKIPMQVDVGFGDAIRPPPPNVRFPSLLDLPESEIKAYPCEAVVAEKFHAVVTLGLHNTRMKDFFDLSVLARDFPFQGKRICLALRATFQRRQTPLPTEAPLALTSEFHDDSTKTVQWRSFLRKNGLAEPSIDLAEVTKLLRAFLLPPAAAVARGRDLDQNWPAGGPWHPKEANREET